MNDPITVEIHVQAPIEKVWQDFTDPRAIESWNTASDDWQTTDAHNDLTVGGTFSCHMAAKDGSAGFDLNGVYTDIVPNERIAYTLEDGRQVETTFAVDGDSVHITQSFEPETENTHEMQRAGWQAILDNFKKYVEA